MKISENWLREWVNPNISTDELAEQLTMLGLEVDDVLAAAAQFSQVRVAEIISIEKHPDADKLNVCQVDAGTGENLQIVCGAPNARKGLKAPLAMIGALLPGNFKIKKSKLRGMPSFGMLCSAVELGLSDDSSGLLELPSDAPIGEDIRDYLALNDSIIDIDLTPNRADCFCIKGVAIDVASLNEIEVKYPIIDEVKENSENKLSVNLQAKKQAPRYLCRVIENIDNRKTTPIWMQEKLRRSGIRSIHPVVDVTNYVMLELGQPMHGFDKSTINGSLTVKMAQTGEKFTLLDGKEVVLDDSYLMIADDEQYLAIAGVMGGLNSGCSENTQHIVLESAYFEPACIMGKSRNLGIFTESALRFERGVDPYLQRQALQRATQLITEICGGDVGPIVEVKADDFIPQNNTIELSQDKLKRVLGFAVAKEKVTTILQNLQMQVDEKENSWSVIAPSSRFDMAIAEDLIEEVVRMIGYDKMPSQNLFAQSIIGQLPEAIIATNTIKFQLTTLGYTEAINYSFVSQKQLDILSIANGSIALKNPLTEEFAIMRTSMLPGLLETVKYNLRRQNDTVKLFETGIVFHKHNEVIIEEDKLMVIATGKRYTQQWGLNDENLDFFDLKGDLESLLSATKHQYTFSQSNDEFLHPGQQARILIGTKEAGTIGQVHPEICRKLGIKKAVYAFEIAMKYISQSQLPSFHDISKFPSVRRDIALLVDESVSYQQIKDIIVKNAGDLLQDVFVFDEYKDESLGLNKRSLAVGLVLQQNNSTLEDKEVDKLMEKMLNSLKEVLRIEIRGQ